MCKLKHIKSWKQLLKLIFTGSYESVYSPLWEVCPPPNSNNNLATEQKWFFPVCLQFNILLEVKRIRYCLQLLCSEECLMLVLKKYHILRGSERSKLPPIGQWGARSDHSGTWLVNSLSVRGPLPSVPPTRSHDQVVRIRRMIKKWLIRNNSYDLTRTN